MLTIAAIRARRRGTIAGLGLTVLSAVVLPSGLSGPAQAQATVTIKTVTSGKCLADNGPYPAVIGTCEGSDQEKWIVESSPTTIKNVATGKCLSHHNNSSHSANSSHRGDSSDGDQSSDGKDTVGIGTCEGSDNERWTTG
ncbi:MAG: RICIN domain-containing protein [Actinomycetota bacterium]